MELRLGEKGSIRDTEYAKQWRTPLDHGIAYAVKVLRDGGIETFESCQGGEGHPFPEPTIRFHGGKGVGFLAVACALQCGLPVSELRRYWTVSDDELHGPYWELTFSPKDRLFEIQAQAESGNLIL